MLTKSCILYRKCVSFKGEENDLSTITICSNRYRFCCCICFRSGVPNEDIVQKHLNIALLNVN